MTGEDEHMAEEAKLLGLIQEALLSGEFPEDLLEFSDEEIAAQDPDRLTRLKAMVKAGDLTARLSVDAPAPLAGFNRGDQAEPADEGLDAARRRVEERIKEKRRASSPDDQAEPR